MLYLAGQIWVAIVAAGLFGAVIGGSCAAVLASASRWRHLPGLLLAVLLAAAIVASGRELVPGRAGLWLDIGLLLVATYLVGCGLGCFLSRLTRLKGTSA